VFVRIEDLLGRRVADSSGRIAGRIEEIRAERRGDDHEITEILLGAGALRERLSIGRRGRKPLVARWDQIDLRRPERIVLLCGVEELSRDGESR
jgi:hypothetical protein